MKIDEHGRAPIDTAKRDGTIIAVYDRNPGEPRIYSVFWDQIQRDFAVADENVDIEPDPTHWYPAWEPGHPLPTAPADLA